MLEQKSTDATGRLERRELEPQHTIGVRVRRTMQDLGAAFDEYLPRIAARIAELGGEMSGPPYARYHTMAADSVDLEIGAPVIRPAVGLRAMSEAEPTEVSASMLPGGQVVVLVHTGPYDQLGATWGMLDGLLGEDGLVPSGPPWESYIDSPDVVPPERLRTEIVTPLG